MNERIEKLAECSGSTHKQSLGVYQFYSHELEEFAKLIIEECIVEAVDEVAFQGGTVQLEAGIRQRIKQYFGIKE